ncbi:MAG: nuclear transport factor 2 family protein [Geminicoccaceae bacterium]
MKPVLATLTFISSLAAISVAWASPTEEMRTLYARFVAAQNARDLDHVRAVLLDSPTFLWVSDGMSVWGPDETLARMASFQKAEVWRVEPNLARSTTVEVSPTVAYLHLPLTLEIGGKAAPRPDRLRFLVSVLGVETAEGWRIAALFTTAEKVR